MSRLASAFKAALTAVITLLGASAEAQVTATGGAQATTQHSAPRLDLRRELAALGGEALRVHWRGEHPTVISGLSVPTAGATPVARAQAFLDAHTHLLAGATLVPVDAHSRKGRTTVRLQQRHEGLRVLDQGATLTLDDEGRVIALHNTVTPLKGVRRATLTEAEARDKAVAAVLGDGPVRPNLFNEAASPRIERGVVAVGNLGVEVFEVEVVRQPLAAHMVVRVDGQSGRVIGIRNRVIQ